MSATNIAHVKNLWRCSELRPTLLTGIAVAVVILALAGSMWLLFGPGAAPYLDVDLLLERQSEMVERPMRLAGRLDGDILRPDAASPARFAVSGARARMTVELAGPIPANLQSGQELLLDGRLREDGIFAADRILTQCTSQYRARLDDAALP
jgi:cytochrome c-type biogenesis protein CcmE